MSLKATLLNYLKGKYPEVVHKGELDRKATEWGYLAENCGRRLRELKNEGYLSVEYKKSRAGAFYAVYRYIQRELPKPEIVAEQLKLI